MCSSTPPAAASARRRSSARALRVRESSRPPGSDEKLARARQLGADEVINYNETPAIGDAVRDLTDGRGVDVCIEMVGGSVLQHSLDALALNGRLATCGAPRGREGRDRHDRVFPQADHHDELPFRTEVDQPRGPSPDGAGQAQAGDRRGPATGRDAHRPRTTCRAPPSSARSCSKFSGANDGRA